MASGDHIQGTDRKVFNVVTVAAFVALISGVTFLITGWQFAKTALFITGPIAVLAIFAAVIWTWWPRNDA